MNSLSKGNIATYLLLVVVVAIVGIKQLEASSKAKTDSNKSSVVEVAEAESSKHYLTVHVAGEVRHPGVYRVADGKRVLAAVEKAGGATKDADLDGLNLASKLTDERQIIVPSTSPSGSGGAKAMVSLNQATVEELQTLDGVGPSTAEKIVEYRESNGGFSKLEELDQVDGIGPKRLETLKEGLVL